MDCKFAAELRADDARWQDMRRGQHVYAVLVLLLVNSVAYGIEPPAVDSDVAELTTLACEMGRAYARQDLDTLNRLNADDYTQTDTRGVVVGHADYLEYVRQRTADVVKDGVSTLTIECDHIEVRVYGDAAVVTGGWTYTQRKPDGNVSRRSRWTSMWTKSLAGWKRHAFQNTWVNPEANQPTPGAATAR